MYTLRAAVALLAPPANWDASANTWVVSDRSAAVDVPFLRVSARLVRALRRCGTVVLAEKVRGGRCVTMERGGWSGEVLWVLCGERGRQDEAPCCDGDWSGIGPDLVLFLDGRVLCGMSEINEGER